ncbi:MAG: PDZ domain-containing protein, partial [Actinomycetota bacterium]
MSSPVVVAVAPGSAAARAGLAIGDVVTTVNGIVPRDVIEWRMAVDEAEVSLEVQRAGIEFTLEARNGPTNPSAPKSPARCSTACARATTTASSVSS